MSQKEDTWDQYLEDVVLELDGMATDLQALGRSGKPESSIAMPTAPQLNTVDNASNGNLVFSESTLNNFSSSTSTFHQYDSVAPPAVQITGVSEENNGTENTASYFLSNVDLPGQERCAQNVTKFATTPNHRTGDVVIESNQHTTFGVATKNQSYAPLETNTVGRHPHEEILTSQNVLSHVVTENCLNLPPSRSVVPQSSHVTSRTNGFYDDVIVENRVPNFPQKDSLISNYDDVESENTAFNNQATLPYHTETFPPPPTYDEGENSHSNSGDRNTFLAVVSSTSRSTGPNQLIPPSNDGELRVEALLGRYPALRSINEPTSSVNEDGNNNMANKRTSATSCVPPHVASPTGSVIDATISRKPERRKKYNCCEVTMAAGIILSIALLILMLIGYFYIGFSLEGNDQN